MEKHRIKNQAKARRRQRVRAKVSGTADKPRLSVYRSLKHISAQLIDDTVGKTVLSVSDKALKSSGKKTDASLALGKELGRQALAKGIKQAVFDKGAYKFHGRVKAVADGAKEAGFKI